MARDRAARVKVSARSAEGIMTGGCSQGPIVPDCDDVWAAYASAQVLGRMVYDL